MLSNPYLPMPSAANAWSEGFVKGFTARTSPAPSANVAEADYEAFNQGVAAGEQCARSGLALDNPCIPASDGEPPDGLEVVSTGWDVVHSLWELRRLKTLASGVMGLLQVAIDIGSGAVGVRSPEEVLPSRLPGFIEKLTSYGFDSLEVFCGAGLDGGSQDCEMCLTPMFPTLAQARDAAIAMRRPTWLVLSWRTDQSRSLRVVDAA